MLDGTKMTLVLLAIASACSPRLDQDTAALERRATALAQSFMATSRTPGLAIGILKHGRPVAMKGFGLAKLGQPDSVTVQTVFHMASVTKVFVAAAVMQLREQGKIDLDSTIRHYVRYFRMKDRRADRITVRQVLNHTAGLPDVTDYRWDHPEYDAAALERYIRGLKDSALIAAPGEKWQYSNIGFELLADLVAKVSGQPFEDYVQRGILTPVGMAHSTLLMTDVDSLHLATGHMIQGDQVLVSQVYPYNRRHAGSSTLHSNVNDMLRWALANLRRGELDGRRILADSSYRLLWTPTRDITNELNALARQAGVKLPFETFQMGLGWFVVDYQGHRLVDHEGSDRGFRSDLLLSPADSAAVVVMANLSQAEVGEFARDLMSLTLER